MSLPLPIHVPQDMEIELSELLGRQIDLRTPKELSRYFRDQVLAGASVQYDRS